MLSTYYLSAFLVSVVLTGLYMFIWHRHFDVHITLVFVLVPVVNLGFLLLSRAQDLGEALLANKITYLGGCFLQLMILLAVFSLCHIRAGRWFRSGLLLLSTGVYLFVLVQGDSGLFYRSVSFLRENGEYVLRRVYGPVHHVFVGVVILYFALSLGAIVYAFLKKKQVSRKVLVLLFLPEIVAMPCYFAGRLLLPRIELMPAAYVLAQVMYLLIVRRIGLYDVTDATVDSLVQSGSTGFVTFDLGYHYLGSNLTARSVFPDLDDMTVDYSIRHYRRMKDLLLPWLQAYGENPEENRYHHDVGDRIFLLTVSWLYNNNRKKGYEIVITDDTLDQQRIRSAEEYNTRLSREVAEKTAHILEMHNQLILSMATMVESRDNSTGGHIRRTREGVRILTEEMNRDPEKALDDDFCRNLVKAAPMHDLGKIAVDDVILRKPDRFTPEEYEQMKAHAPEGARIVHEILRNTDDDAFHELAENVAHYHHERWDGKGYPDGLKGEEIPLEARIMAVADVYDALVSKWVYKEKMTFEKANEIIEEGMGTQFDPSLRDVYRAARPRLEAYYATV